jgi:hypothetical protein
MSVLMLGLVVSLASCNEPSQRPGTEPKATPTATKAAATPTPTKAAMTPTTTTTATMATTTARAVAPKGPALPPVVGKAVEGKFALRVNCGGRDYTDKNNVKWSADQAYNATRKYGYITAQGVGATASHPMDALDPLYSTERWGMTSYRFDVPDGKYTVRLHMAEIYDVVAAPGVRVFGISLQGKTVVEKFDPTKEAGFGKVTVKEFKDVTVSDGKLVIGFEKIAEFPTIQAIEVLQQ